MFLCCARTHARTHTPAFVTKLQQHAGIGSMKKVAAQLKAAKPENKGCLLYKNPAHDSEQQEGDALFFSLHGRTSWLQLCQGIVSLCPKNAASHREPWKHKTWIQFHVFF